MWAAVCDSASPDHAARARGSMYGVRSPVR